MIVSHAQQTCDAAPELALRAQVVDKAGSAPYLLRQFYQRHLLRFQAVSSSLESTARQQRRLACCTDSTMRGKRPASATQSAAEEAAEILGSLTGTNGLTPDEYISAVAPAQSITNQAGLCGKTRLPVGIQPEQALHLGVVSEIRNRTCSTDLISS